MTSTIPPASDRQANRDRGDRTTLDTTLIAPAASPSAKQAPWLLAALLVCVLPIAAFALYRALGNPAALDASSAAANGSGFTSQQIVAMVDRLAERMKATPDDPRGWALLARSYMALDRYREAADAYAKLDALTPNDANVLADYADALAMAQGRSLEGKPRALVAQALSIDPRQKKALALAASAAADAGDYAAARDYTQRLLATLPPASDEAKEVNAMLTELTARAAADRGGLRKEPSTNTATARAGGMRNTPSIDAATPSAASSAGAEAIRGTVRVKADLASRVAPDDTVFIFARNTAGPRMPLAVRRISAKQLPAAFVLDDSMAMAPTAKLSTASSVVIEARVSKTGNATPQSGDIFGKSAPVAPGAKDVTVELDSVVP